MKILSWNTNGLRATYKQGNLLPLFTQLKPDILCLQEVKATEEQLTDEIKNIPGYYSYFVSPLHKKGYSGVGVYTKMKPEKVEYGIGVKDLDTEGRTLVLYFKDFVLITCYFPNGGSGPDRLEYKLQFYDAFLSFVNKLRKKGHEVIFCGDINTAHTEIDLARPKQNEENTGFLPIEREWIDQVINSGYIDVYREMNPKKTGAYTYWDQKTRARERNVGWRIDYFFTSPKIYSRIKKAEIHSEVIGSDHCPIEITL